MSSQELKQKFAKGAELILKSLTIYESKADAMLAWARNFTDQEVRREGSVLGALKEFFTSVFGGEVWMKLTFIFGPSCLTMFSFLGSIIVAVPVIIEDLRTWRGNKREKGFEKELLLVVRDESIDYSYGLSPQTDLTMVPALVIDVGDGRYMAAKY